MSLTVSLNDEPNNGLPGDRLCVKSEPAGISQCLSGFNKVVDLRNSYKTDL